MDTDDHAAHWPAPSVVGPLNGVRVVDFGQWIAGPLTATLLADQGASVVRIEAPTGPRWNHVANTMLLRNRHSITLDLHDAADRATAQTLMATADVVIENFRPGVADRLGIGRQRAIVANPRLVYCSIPGFGHDDPRAAQPAWEGAVMAAGGAYSSELSGALTGVGAGSDPVEFSPLPLASVFAATESAMAIVAALMARERDGLGQWIEVPLFDALFEASGVRAMTFERGGLALTDFGNGFYQCGDGRWVTFVAMWFRHLEWFISAAGMQQWISEGVVDFDRLWHDSEAGNELRRRLIALFATRTAAEWEELGRDHGCTIAMMRSTEQWLNEPHAMASGTVLDIDDPLLGRVRVPGPAITFSARDVVPARPPRRSGAAPTTAALAGVRVLDLSRVVAAPTAAKLLAQFGADVIKIDADPAVGRASFREPALHEHLNRGKQTIIVDLTSDEGQRLLPRLLAQCDVVVHNFGAAAARRLGIDEPSVRAHAPHVVYLHVNAFGETGPWRDHRGYAELANLTTGITERSIGETRRDSGSSPLIDNPRWFFTDYLTGVLGAYAALVGLYHRDRTGHGARVTTSLVRAAMLEQVLYMVGGARDAACEPRGAAPGWAPLQRLYATRDGTVFVGAPESQLDRVFAALATDPIDASSDAHNIEQALAHALARLTSAECVDRLRIGRVGVHAVTTLAELMTEGGVADRRGLRVEDHTEQAGAIVMPGPVAFLSRTPMQPGALPGPFGSDHDDVFRRWSPEKVPAKAAESGPDARASDAPRPGRPRWTHVALPVADLDASLAWYAANTPFALLDRRTDPTGSSAWLGHADQSDHPFILVLVCEDATRGRGPHTTLSPFAHIGIEMGSRAEVDAVARRAVSEGNLHWPVADLGPPIGYLCAVLDPDANVVEFSYDQGVYEKARLVWGRAKDTPEV